MYVFIIIIRLYNLKDHRELGALMQHEGENWHKDLSFHKGGGGGGRGEAGGGTSIHVP